MPSGSLTTSPAEQTQQTRQHRSRSGARDVCGVVADAVAGICPGPVFTLMGGTNQELICELAEHHGRRLVLARHEAGAVSMADGFAWFSGMPGLATVTAGPGVTNTATALAVARSHRSPVLVLAGDVATGDRHNPQRLDQQAFGRLLAGCAVRPVSQARVASSLTRARQALAASMPVLFSLPADIQDQPCRPGTPGHIGSAVPLPGHDAIRAALELLARARRPMVLAGRGVVTSGAGRAVHSLAEGLGAPAGTTIRANGLFAGSPLDVGVAGPLGDGRCDEALGDCDLVVAIGTSLNPLAVPALPAATAVLHLNADRAEIDSGRTYLPLLGEVAAATCALVEGIRGRRVGRASTKQWRRVNLDTGPYLDGDQTVDPRRVCAELDRLLPTERRVVLGGGQVSLTAAQLVRSSDPNHWLHASVDFGAIGQSLAIGIGACFAAPGERVVHITGDGDFMMGLADLDTAVRYRLPLTIVVLNDQAFGQERGNLRRAAHSTYAADYPSPDLVAVARSLGAAGCRIGTADDLSRLEPAVRADRGPVVVDVRISEYRHPASGKVAAALTRRPD